MERIKFLLPNFYQYKTGVYLVTDGFYIKVGKTTNIVKTISELERGNPHNLNLISFVECNSETEAFEMESFIKKEHQQYNKNREWFYDNILSSRIIKKIFTFHDSSFINNKETLIVDSERLNLFSRFIKEKNILLIQGSDCSVSDFELLKQKWYEENNIYINKVTKPLNIKYLNAIFQGKVGTGKVNNKRIYRNIFLPF